MIDIEPIVATVRWYNENDSYEQKSAYAAIATIHLMNKDTVYISGMHGVITRARLQELAIWLKQHGIIYAFAQRKDKWKKYDVDHYAGLRKFDSK